MSKILINLTRLTQQVGVRHADQKLDCVRIVPQGRVTLREGMTIDSRWLHANPTVLRVLEKEAKVVAPVVAVETPVVEGDE